MRITFTTDNPVIAEHFPVVPMKKAVPDWYKRVPNFVEEGGDTLDALLRDGGATNRTIRACVPVLDYLTSGYVIRSSVHTRARNEPSADGEPGLVYMTSDTRMMGTHGHGQCPVHIEGARRTYIKFNSPWTIRTPKGYSCLFYQPFYDDLAAPRLRLFLAIVDTDTYDKPINFPGYFLGTEEVEVRPGDALMGVFPFKRDAWEADILVEPPRQSVFDHFLQGAYRRIFWRQKSYK